MATPEEESLLDNYRRQLNALVKEAYILNEDIADKRKELERLQKRAYRLYKKIDSKLDVGE